MVEETLSRHSGGKKVIGKLSAKWSVPKAGEAFSHERVTTGDSQFKGEQCVRGDALVLALRYKTGKPCEHPNTY